MLFYHHTKTQREKRRFSSTETSPILSEEQGKLLSLLKAKDSQSSSIQNQSSENKLEEIAESNGTAAAALVRHTLIDSILFRRKDAMKDE